MAVLEVTRVGATAVITLNRPEQRNALDDALRSALAIAVADVRADAGVRSVVLRGAGGHFCSGGDVKAMAQLDGHGDLGFLTRDRLAQMHRWFDELVDLEKPVIAAVEGTAYGAGLSLALAADFVLTAASARFCAAFSRIGLVPDAGAMYLLPRQVGLSCAKDLVFSARVVDAEEAVRVGLAHAMVDGDVLEGALAFAKRFNEAPPQAIGLAKSIMNHAFESDRHSVYALEGLAQAVCRESAGHRKAMEALQAQRR